MAPKTTPKDASPTTAPKEAAQKQETIWIEGAKPNFQTVRLSRDGGRVFFGAKGWCKPMNRSEWVSLELSPAGLAQLIKAAQAQLSALIAA